MCRMHELNLNPGRYTLAVSIVRGSRRIDYVATAAEFDVLESDVYGTGYPMATKYGVIYLRGEWELRPA